MKKTVLTIFLCSTFADLSEEREQVLDAIRRLQLKHDSMEYFGARAERPIETCLDEVRRSDVLVVIVGHRYGSMVPGLDISYSEAEYAEGYKLGKPCLVYLRSDDVPILPRHIEQDPQRLGKLAGWKRLLQDRHTVAPFLKASDLAIQVTADLGRTVQALKEAQHDESDADSGNKKVLAGEIEELIASGVRRGLTEDRILSTLRRSIANLLTAEGRPPVVFLSYSSADREIVRKVALGLREAGIDAWFDQLNLSAGDRWISEIQRALDSADFIAVFLSENSVNRRGYAQKEINLAMSRVLESKDGVRLIPILLSEEVEVPPLLRTVHWISMKDGDVSGVVEKLVAAIYTWSSGSSGPWGLRPAPNPAPQADG
jgi:hypothetical protein